MAKQKILLGGIVKDEVTKINENFTEVYNGLDAIPTNTSDLTNDSNFVDTTELTNAINAAKTEVAGDIPTKLSELDNDANYVKTTDAVLVNKVDRISGKDLSTNDYTNADKAKVDNLGKINFTTGDFGTAQADGYVYATLAATGKYPVKVFKADGSNYEEVIVQTSVEGNNIVICADAAFTGYVVTI